MTALLQKYQLDIMLGLGSVCLMIAVFAGFTRQLPRYRRRVLIYLELASAFLLFFDRAAYIFRGDTGALGMRMVRISNFCVFMLILSFMHAMNLYVCDLCRHEIGLSVLPGRLKLVEVLICVGWVMVVISQFTGAYYYIDENNIYHRGEGFILGYIIPFVVLLIELSVIIEYHEKLRRRIFVSLLLFSLTPVAASVLQIFIRGISITNIVMAALAVLLYAYVIQETDDRTEEGNRQAIDAVNRQRSEVQKVFDSMVKAVAAANDTKDERTKGHAERIAGYAREIAKRAGMDEIKSWEVYYSAMLMDSGGTFADTAEYPFLGDAAKYMNENYDGHGNRLKLKGKDIPETARIAAVAEAYDDLTSYMGGREPLAQGKVRDSLESGMGRHLDPEYVRIMMEMIDQDADYMMREFEESSKETETNDLTKAAGMHFGDYKERVTDGIRITEKKLKIKLKCKADKGFEGRGGMPAIILFDSFDSCVHRNERSIKNQRYMEFGEIWFDGHTICTSARDIKAENEKTEGFNDSGTLIYEVEAVKYRDHARVMIKSEAGSSVITVALPDAARFVYMALTGEYCRISDISVDMTDEEIDETYIRRIAGEVSFLNRMEGDLPNVQIDGYRSASSAGVLLYDGMNFVFHTMSLPTADLVLHCPYVLIYSADDGKIGGKNYHEYACIRIDGEDGTDGDTSVNTLTVKRSADFAGWDAWKEYNKKGYDCEIGFKRRGNRITVATENAGLFVKCVTKTGGGAERIYAALTGDQCAFTDIRVV